MKINARIYLLEIFVFSIFIVLLLGLFHTQVVQGEKYRSASEHNRIRLIRLEAPRGNIYDRHGILLATNRPSYNAYIIPEDFDTQDMVLLMKLLNMSEQDIRTKMAQVRGISFTPVL